MMRFFIVDPAGVAPAYLGANARMLLYTSWARIHKIIIKTKEAPLQGPLMLAPRFGS